MKLNKPLTLILALLLLIAPMVVLKPTYAQHSGLYFVVNPKGTYPPNVNGTISGSNNQNLEVNPLPNPVGKIFTVEVHMLNATDYNLGGVNVNFNITQVINTGYASITSFTDNELTIWADALTTRDGLYWFDALGNDYKVNATGFNVTAPYNFVGIPVEYEWAGASADIGYNGADALLVTLTFTVINQPPNGNPAVVLPLVLDYNNYVQTYAIDLVSSSQVLPIPSDIINGAVTIDPAPAAPVTLPPDMTLSVVPSSYTASAQFEIFTIAVDLTADAAWDVAGFDINFTYPASQLNVISVGLGGFLTQHGDATFGWNDTSVAGRVFIVYTKLSNNSACSGTDSLFTVTFEAMTVYLTSPPGFPLTISQFDIAGWPHPEIHHAPWNSNYSSYLTPYVTTVNNGVYYPPSLGPKIDLFTLGPEGGSPPDPTFPWTAPYTGVGANQHSDAFAPQQLVCLYAKVSYNNYTVGNKLVTFEVHDASGAKITILTAYTNWSDSDPAGSGIAKVCFRLPMTNTFQNGSAPTILGWWWAIATVDLDMVIVNDTMPFQVGYLFTVLNVVPNGAPYHLPTGTMSFTVTVQTISEQNRSALISVDEYDTQGYPIGEQVYWLMLVHATRGTCAFTGNATTTIPGIFVNTVTATYPSWSRAGTASVIAYPLTDFPRYGGISWGPSASNTFGLVYP